jgi:hypothetical protein
MRARRIEWTCYLPDMPLRPCRRHHFHGYAWTGSTFTAAASEPAPSPASRLLQWDCVHPADSRSIGGMHASGICVHPAGSHSIERACMHARGNCAHSAGCMSIERACTTFVGAGLLAKAACQARTMSDGPTSSRASALLQWNGVHPVRTTSAGDGFHRTYRSRLAGEGGVSGEDDVGWADLFAGKRAPTMDGVHPAGSCSIGGMHASGNCVHSAGLHFDRAGFHHIRRSRLAGEGGVSGEDDVGWAAVFAGKRAPTMALRASDRIAAFALRH